MKLHINENTVVLGLSLISAIVLLNIKDVSAETFIKASPTTYIGNKGIICIDGGGVLVCQNNDNEDNKEEK